MKKEIIQTTITLYAKYGIKGVTMDQIAKQMCISKKTIYQEFENKEQLVNEVVNMGNNRILRIIKGSEAQAQSPLEAVLLISANLYNYLRSFCPTFYRNINRFKSAEKIMDKSKEYTHQRFTYHFLQGVEHEIFIPENDYQVVSAIYIEQLKDVQPQHQLTTTFTFLRGICTTKGQYELKHYANMYNQSNINYKNIYEK